jgi:hypothetical protein
VALDRNTLFREVNERIADAGSDALFEVGEVREFLCECGRDGCRELFPLTYAAYREAHRSRDTFLVAPGHDDPAHDRVTQRLDGYWVVEALTAAPAS